MSRHTSKYTVTAAIYRSYIKLAGYTWIVVTIISKKQFRHDNIEQFITHIGADCNYSGESIIRAVIINNIIFELDIFGVIGELGVSPINSRN